MADHGISSSFVDRPAVGFHVGQEPEPAMLSERNRSRSFVSASLDSIAMARQSAAAAVRAQTQVTSPTSQANIQRFQQFIQEHKPDTSIVPSAIQRDRQSDTALDDVLHQLERTLVVEEEAMQARIRSYQEQETRAFNHLRAHVAHAIHAADGEDRPVTLQRLQALAQPARIAQLLDAGRESLAQSAPVPETPLARNNTATSIGFSAPSEASSAPSPAPSAGAAGPLGMLRAIADDAVSVTSSLNVEASVTRSERGDESVLDGDMSFLEETEEIVGDGNISTDGELADDDAEDTADEREANGESAAADVDLSRSVPVNIIAPSNPLAAAAARQEPKPEGDAMELARSIRELSMSIRNELEDNFSPPKE
eukprot:TRINITY_DN12404_c1_g1_i1.p1 TRINITY_DN12404_c1_g1~~TRINITY_DN12404_c1_g1_i1.p1  ORF type:complete len:368 (+),score=77.96 TRINITY_DN12404_c1_g1_i1:182-1285(+)